MQGFYFFVKFGLVLIYTSNHMVLSAINDKFDEW